MANDDNNKNDETWSCCNDEQTLFLLLYIAFVALAVLTWKTLLAKPMRLMAVFIHEMSHAIACWLTCGDVRTIHVYENEGGVTKYVGGCRCLIIPAGYVGCSIWAMLFVILSGGRKTATFAAIVFLISLLLALCYSPNSTMISICMGYAVLTLTFLLIEWYVYTPILQFLILFYGVFCGIYALEDIHTDTILRSVEGSDAYACHAEVCPCCVPRCIGLQWAILAICFQALGIWLALVEMSEECQDRTWFECWNVSIDMERLFDWDFTNDWDFDGFWHNGP
jgi:hypothetical protein